MLKSLKLALFTATLICTIGSANADAWQTSYSEAVKLAKKSGKPIMIDFTGSDWCGWCIKLHQEVFDKPEFKKWATKNVVLLELDFPRRTPQPKALKDQNESLEHKYHSVIEGFPTVLFINPDGTVFGKYGYDEGGPTKWTQMASRLLPLRKTVAKR